MTLVTSELAYDLIGIFGMTPQKSQIRTEIFTKKTKMWRKYPLSLHFLLNGPSANLDFAGGDHHVLTVMGSGLHCTIKKF